MLKDNAINFLLNSYFGISLDADDEQIINVAINKAYDDATMRNALMQKNKQHKDGRDWNAEYQKLYNNTKKERNACNKEAKACCIDLIRTEFVEKFVKKDDINQEQYNQIHSDICKKIEETYDKKYDEQLKTYDKVKDFCAKENNHQKYFTIGNAQKWVNMTMKNLYILKGVFTDRIEFVDSVVPFLHIPIDNIILCGAYMRIKADNEKKNDWLESENDCIKEVSKLESYAIKSIDEKKTEKMKYVAWSNLETYEDYDNIQKVLMCLAKVEGEKPIEWECRVWLESAKKMKKE